MSRRLDVPQQPERGPDRAASGVLAAEGVRLVPAMRAIGRAVEESLDPVGIAQAAGEALKELLRADVVLVGIAAERGNAIHLLYATDPEIGRRVYRLNVDAGVSGQAFQQQNVVVVRNYPAWDAATAQGLEFDTRTAMACPLLVAGRSVGVVTITWRSPHGPTTEEGNLLQALAAYVAPALDASRLGALAEQGRRDNQVLLELIGATAGDHDAAHFLHSISETAGRLVQADDAAIAILRGDGSAQVYFGWIDRAPTQRMVTIRADEGVTGEVLRAGKKVLSHCPEVPGPIQLLLGSFRAVSPRTIVGLPLIDRSTIVGVLVMGWDADLEEPPEQIELATALARYAAGAVERSRMRARERGFQEVARELANHADVGQALELALAHVVSLLEAAYAAVWLRGPEGEFVLAAMAGDRLLAAELEPLTSECRADHVVRGELISIPNGPPDDGSVQGTDGRNARSPAYLGVPICRAQDILGIAEVIRTGPQPFRSSDERLLVEFAGMIAVAVSAARVRAHGSDSDGWFHATLEQLPSGVIVLDADGRVAFMNRAGRRMATRPLEVGQPLVNQTADLEVSQAQAEGARSISDLVAALFAGEEFEDLPLVVRDPLQRVDVHVQATGRVLRDAQGQTIGAVGVFTDTTLERRLTQEVALATRENAFLRGELEERNRRLHDLAGALVEPADPPDVTLHTLGVTRREQEILQLLIGGRTNAEIAAELHLSAGTVKLHVKRILAKLGTPTRTAAAVRALQLGLVPPAKDALSKERLGRRRRDGHA
jgi:DNA-binding CsgD family transcriptional regulator/GAF domain-containing protein